MIRVQKTKYALLLLLVFAIILTFDNNSTNAELIPKGYVDTPLQNSTVKGETLIRGWFLDSAGVSKVEVFIDGKSAGVTQYGLARTDVFNAFPEYNNMNSGFSLTLNTKSYSNGTHNVLVKGTNTIGITTIIGNYSINIQNPATKGYLETPVYNSTVKGIVNVRGWILDYSGVSTVEVQVDGKVIGQAQSGLPRPDVGKAFPEYLNDNSGFLFSLNTKELSNGQHTMVVKSISQNGSTFTLQQVFQVQNPLVVGYIDSPSTNTTVKGTLDVTGWFLDVSGVSKIEVLVDDKKLGDAQYGISRTDVANAYPDFNNPNSGFKFSINTTGLANGLHSLTIRETGVNGSVNLLQSKFNVQNMPVKGYIQSPAKNIPLKGIVDVSGWILDAAGVAKVEVLVDGNIMGDAQYGLSRLDVLNVFPEYKNSNSGLAFKLDTKGLTNGTHTLTVRETGNTGLVTSFDVPVTIQNPAPIGYIDAPGNGSSIKGDVVVRGWYLDVSGVSKIEVLVDGTVLGVAEYGLPRADVGSSFPVYGNSNSGFSYTLNTKVLQNGQRTITIKETGKNGAVSTYSSVVNVQNPSPIGSIDTPANGEGVQEEISVTGWFLDMSGVSKVEVYVDGNFMGVASYGEARPDVLAAFPTYNTANGGYRFTFSSLSFSQGQHTLTVKETGVNGATSSISSNFIVGNPYLYIDLRKPSNITVSDIVNFFNSNNRGDSPLKTYAQEFINAQNKYGVSAQYLVAHAILETGWGGSNLKTYKNNLFGYGAYDSCPFTCGYYFPSGGEAINYEAYIVRLNYLMPGGTYFNGSNLTGMNVRYATDPLWASKIANLMSRMKAFDPNYYLQTPVHSGSAVAVSTPGRNIPTGLPYPTDVIINFDMGRAAVTTTGLSFRSLPYVSAATLIKNISIGTTVTVLGYNTDVAYYPNDMSKYPYDQLWYRVIVNGQEGWLYGGGLAFK